MTLASDIAQIAADTVIFHEIVNGDASETVMTESGAVDTLAAAISKIGAVNYRGDWTAVTAYAIGDAVAWSGALYRCIIAHTSGNNVVLGPTQDAADWVVQNAQPANVTNAQMANMATARIKGRSSAGTGDPEDLTGSQVADLVAPSLLFGLRNKLINANFDHWKRGTSFSDVAQGTYCPDRWKIYTASASAVNVTRQAADSALPGSTYYMRVQRASGTNIFQAVQLCETHVVKSLLGKSCTLSMKLRKGSALTGNLTVKIETDTAEGGFTTVESATTTIAASSLSTSTWTAITPITLAIPANSAALGIQVSIAADSQAGGADVYFEVAQVQLEEGAVATLFEQRPIGLEEMLCARYLPIIKSQGVETDIGTGQALSTSRALCAVPFKTPARTKPTGIVVSNAAHFSSITAAGGTCAFTGAAFFNSGLDFGTIDLTGGSGLAAGDATICFMDYASAYIYFTGCEL